MADLTKKQNLSDSINDVSQTPEYNSRQTPKHMRGRVGDISLNGCLIIVPMLLFPAVLLGLVFAYRVLPVAPLHSNLALKGETPESGVYYVDFPATRLIFVSSWSSSVAPLLVSSVLALFSYLVAPKMLKRPDKGDEHVLPTPYQLSLMLSMLQESGFKPLWAWTKYRLGFGWSAKRQPQGSSLTSVTSVFLTATVLGLLVFVADTWLHLTIQTIPFTQTQQLSSPPPYSYQLTDNCTIGNNSFMSQVFLAPHNNQGGCTLGVSDPSQISAASSLTFILDGSRALQVLNNVSNLMTVSNNYQNDPSGVPYLSPVDSDLSEIDYTANTYGAHTTCVPITRKCGLTSSSQTSMPYSCSESFSGDLSNRGGGFWILTYFTDNTLQSNSTLWGIQNPYTWALAAAVNLEGGGTLRTSSDPEIVARDAGGTAFIVQCETTLYDIYYESVNNTITRFWPQQSNASVANIAQSTVSWAELTQPYLQAAASLATFSDNAQQLADKIALAYSRAVMALFSVAVNPVPVEVAQQRMTRLVTRVPAAPLFAVVVTNLLFVLIALLLMIIALAVSAREATEVQARLSTVGLIAEWFTGSQKDESVSKKEEWFQGPDGNEKPDRVHFERVGANSYQLRRTN